MRAEAPDAYAALSSAGASVIAYSDRYLLTPLNLVLLREVLTAAPGCSGAEIRVALAPADRSARHPYAVYDAYADDAARREVLRNLLPAARVTAATRKADLPHHRRLELTLRDGRRMTILLDQGFGGWRTPGEVRHDFAAAPAAQARAIAGLNLPVRAAEPRGYPLTIVVA